MFTTGCITRNPAPVAAPDAAAARKNISEPDVIVGTFKKTLPHACPRSVNPEKVFADESTMSKTECAPIDIITPFET